MTKNPVKKTSVDRIRCDVYNDDVSRIERVSRAMPSAEVLESAARVCLAMSHPIRAAIMAAIRLEPLCVCELSTLLNMSSPALMHHLRILAQSGAIETRKVGKFAIYQPTNAMASSTLSAVLDAA